MAFWKFFDPPLHHPLDANGQHPIFASMQKIKHYRCKFIKLEPTGDFAVLFKVKPSSTAETIMEFNNVFNNYITDIEKHDYRIYEDTPEIMDILKAEFGYPM